jgi:hypothetical protein
MSGLIFSLFLGAISLSALVRALKENPEFRKLSKDRGWRGYVEEDRYRVEVFVKRDEKQVQFILPDHSIPEETCKKAVKKLTRKLFVQIPEVKTPLENVSIVGPSGTFCHYCLEPARELLFKCKRCGGFYCGNHRLPEEHNCPSSGTTGIRTKQKRKEKEREGRKEEKPRKVIIKEIPCG